MARVLGFRPLQLVVLGAGSWLLFTEGGNAAVTSMVPQAAEFLAILPKLPGSGPADAAANGDQAAGNGNGGSNGNGVAQPANERVDREKQQKLSDDTSYTNTPLGGRPDTADIRAWIDRYGSLGHGSASYDHWWRTGRPRDKAGHPVRGGG